MLVGRFVDNVCLVACGRADSRAIPVLVPLHFGGDGNTLVDVRCRAGLQYLLVLIELGFNGFRFLVRPGYITVYAAEQVQAGTQFSGNHGGPVKCGLFLSGGVVHHQEFIQVHCCSQLLLFP